MDKKELKKEEYEYQLYGYSSREIIMELKDILISVTEQQTDALEQTLMKHYKKPEQQLALKKATDCFRSKCTESITEHMPKLQSIVHEMFGIPDNVLLPEDSVHQHKYTEEDEKQLDAATEQLITRAKKALFLESCLKEELQDLRKIISDEAKIKELQELHHHRNQIITETTERKHDDVVNNVVELKNYAKRLELLEDQYDVLDIIAEKKFASLSI